MTTISKSSGIVGGRDVLSQQPEVKPQLTKKSSLKTDLFLQELIADPAGSVTPSSMNQLRDAVGSGKLAVFLCDKPTDTLTGLYLKISKSGLPEPSKQAVVSALVSVMPASEVPKLYSQLQFDPAALAMFCKSVIARGLTPHKLALMPCLNPDSSSAEVNLLLRSKDFVVGGARVKPKDVWNHFELVA